MCMCPCVCECVRHLYSCVSKRWRVNKTHNEHTYDKLLIAQPSLTSHYCSYKHVRGSTSNIVNNPAITLSWAKVSSACKCSWVLRHSEHFRPLHLIWTNNNTFSYLKMLLKSRSSLWLSMILCKYIIIIFCRSKILPFALHSTLCGPLLTLTMPGCGRWFPIACKYTLGCWQAALYLELLKPELTGYHWATVFL